MGTVVAQTTKVMALATTTTTTVVADTMVVTAAVPRLTSTNSVTARRVHV